MPRDFSQHAELAVEQFSHGPVAQEVLVQRHYSSVWAPYLAFNKDGTCTLSFDIHSQLAEEVVDRLS
jgi:hypothetical protein